MAFPRNSLRAFLVQAKTSLRTALSQKQDVTLVIGNESAGSTEYSINRLQLT
jgi:exopolyphosphatase